MDACNKCARVMRMVYLVRNTTSEILCERPRVGDFSFNIANRLAARLLQESFWTERVTASYDLKIFNSSNRSCGPLPPEMVRG